MVLDSYFEIADAVLPAAAQVANSHPFAVNNPVFPFPEAFITHVVDRVTAEVTNSSSRLLHCLL